MPNNKEKQLQSLCQEIYQTSLKRIRPLYPWVLVRVLPKEQQIGHVILPEKQNKTVREGIVLETWYRLDIETVHKLVDDGTTNVHHLWHTSNLRRGDRVMFSYAEGMPVPFLDEQNYRLVREIVDQTKEPRMGVMGKLEYDGDNGLKEKLDEMFSGLRTLTMSGA